MTQNGTPGIIQAMKARPVLDSMVPYTPGKLVPGKLKLASNENPLGPSPKAMEAFVAAASRLSLYPDGGAIDLKDALAQYWGLTRNHFLLGNGSDEVLVMIAAAFLNPQDHVLLGERTFSEYRFASLLFDGSIEAVPMPDGRFDTKSFLKALKPQTKAIFLCSPNNPTGTIISSTELRAFLEQVPGHILVVLDAAYAEYVDSAAERGYPRELEVLAAFPNLLVLHTFSKIYGIAGLRVGYAMANPEIIGNLEKVRQPFNVNLPAQAAAIAALGDLAFVEESRRVNSAGKLTLYQLFDSLGLEYLPSEANFVAVNVRRDSKVFFQAVMDEGVTIRPMASFGYKKWIRVTIGKPEQLELFARAFRAALMKIPEQPDTD